MCLTSDFCALLLICLVCTQALLKPLAKASKYLAKHLREQLLDDAMHYISMKKYDSIAELIRSTLLIATKRREQLTMEKEELLASPAGLGLDPLEPFVIQPAVRVPIDTPMQYVEVLLQLSSISRLQASGGSLMAVLPQAAALDLVTKSRDKNYRAKLLKLAHNLEAKLGILESDRWKLEDEQFKVSSLCIFLAWFVI